MQEKINTNATSYYDLFKNPKKFKVGELRASKYKNIKQESCDDSDSMFFKNDHILKSVKFVREDNKFSDRCKSKLSDKLTITQKNIASAIIYFNNLLTCLNEDKLIMVPVPQYIAIWRQFATILERHDKRLTEAQKEQLKNTIDSIPEIIIERFFKQLSDISEDSIPDVVSIKNALVNDCKVAIYEKKDKYWVRLIHVMISEAHQKLIKQSNIIALDKDFPDIVYSSELSQEEDLSESDLNDCIDRRECNKSYYNNNYHNKSQYHSFVTMKDII